MLWIPETTVNPFAHIAYLASVTENLHFATGIANIYHRLAGVTRQASATLAEQSNGRFLLGLGISRPLVEGLRQIPYETHRNNAIVSQNFQNPLHTPLSHQIRNHNV